MAEKKTKEEQRKKSEQLHSLRVQKIKELYYYFIFNKILFLNKINNRLSQSIIF